MILRSLIAGAIALALMMTSAEARPHHHGHAYQRVKCVGPYCAIVSEPAPTRDSSWPRDC